MLNCATVLDIDELFDILEDDLKNNHFVKKMFAARRMAVNVAPVMIDENNNQNTLL